MKTFLKFFIYLFILLISFSSHSKIKTIKVTSENSEFNTLSQESLRSFVNKDFNLNQQNLMRQKLIQSWSRSGYYTADIIQFQLSQNLDLIVTCKNPILYKINILGVSALLNNNLYSFLDLNRYHTSNPNFQYDLAQKIKSFYLNRGNARADVKFQIEDNQKNTRVITFEVTEGPRVRISSLRFIGQLTQPNEFYETQLIKNSPKLIKSGYYNREDLEKGLKNLIEYLWSLGFLKAQASINRTVFSHDRSRIDISILFYEGVQTLYQGAKFEGLKLTSPEILNGILNIKPFTPLSLNTVEERILKIQNYYEENAFLQMKFKNYGPQLIEYNLDYSKAWLNLVIDEGPQIFVSEIEIQGLELTQAQIIHKELEFKVGDSLTKEKIKESQDRLYLTGLFRDIKIKLEPEYSDQGERKVVIQVLEREPGLLNFGFGAHNERGLTLRGFAGVSYNNLMGTARAASARIEGQYNLINLPFFERSIQFNYLEPYLFSTRTRGRIGLSRSTLITDYNNTIASEANRTTYTLEQNVTPKLLLRWLPLELTSFKDFQVDNQQETNFLEIGSTQVSFEYDKRDHPFTPTKGVHTQGYFELANPALLSSPWIQYYKTQVNWSQYFELVDDSLFVFAFGARWGFLWNDESGDYKIPYDKVGFFLGGQSNLRGFTFNETFPNTNDLGGNNYQLQGHSQLRLLKFELRVPIWQAIGTALFYDMGDIQFSNQAYNSGWRKSAGVAFRYQTPVGAVSFEYAWKLPPNNERNENPSAFHFSIGTF